MYAGITANASLVSGIEHDGAQRQNRLAARQRRERRHHEVDALAHRQQIGDGLLVEYQHGAEEYGLSDVPGHSALPLLRSRQHDKRPRQQEEIMDEKRDDLKKTGLQGFARGQEPTSSRATSRTPPAV